MAIYDNDNRSPVDASAYPRDGIVKILGVFPNGVTFSATGFFVDPTHVLTAGHVVYDAAEGGWAALSLVPAMNGSDRPYGTVDAAYLHSVSGWTRDANYDYDYGLITLDYSPRTSFFGLYAYDDATLRGGWAQTAGYPTDVSDGRHMYGTAGLVERVTPYQLRARGSLDDGPGNSGSPLWFDTDQGPYAIGIDSHDSALGNAFTRITQSVVDNVTAWIRDDEDNARSGTLRGTTGIDWIVGTSGDDDIGAGRGTDTVVEPGRYFDAQFDWYGNGLLVNTTRGGWDLLRSVERVRFDDGVLILDGGPNGDEAYRLYQAAFARQPDEAGLMVQIDALDRGTGLVQLARNFLGSAEFVSRYGRNPSDAQYVDALYHNVLGRTPDAGGRAVQLDALAHGLSRAQLLVNFSESAENKSLTGAYTDVGLFTSLYDPAYG